MEKRNYLKPELTTLNLESQSVLASSNPSITNPPMQWETNENPSVSNPTMPWGTQRKGAPWE